MGATGFDGTRQLCESEAIPEVKSEMTKEQQRSSTLLITATMVTPL
jgi:hypothetical protein